MAFFCLFNMNNVMIKRFAGEERGEAEKVFLNSVY